MKKEYKENSEKILTIYEIFEPDNKNLYMSLAYQTWFGAKKLNQKEWPIISET